MLAIDDVCRNDDGTKAPFTNAQIKVLKEISFRIVYILDPMNKQQRGFANALRREFAEKSAMEKVGAVVAAVTFIASAVGGLYSFGTSAYELYQKHFVVSVQPAAAQPSSQTPSQKQSGISPLPMLAR